MFHNLDSLSIFDIAFIFYISNYTILFIYLGIFTVGYLILVEILSISEEIGQNIKKIPKKLGEILKGMVKNELDLSWFNTYENN